MFFETENLFRNRHIRLMTVF